MSVAYTWNEIYRIYVRTQRKVLLGPFLASALTYIFTRAAFCETHAQPPLLLEGLAPWIVMLAVFTVIGYLRPWMRVMEEKQKGEYRGQAMNYLLSPSGISVEAENSRSYISWKIVSRAKETKNDFYIFRKGDLLRFHFIPKRCLSSVADLVALRTLLQEHLGSRAVLCG